MQKLTQHFVPFEGQRWCNWFITCCFTPIHLVLWHFYSWHKYLNSKKFFNFIFISVYLHSWLLNAIHVGLLYQDICNFIIPNCLKYFNGVHWETSSGTGLNEFTLTWVGQVGGCSFLHWYVLPCIWNPLPFVCSSVSVSHWSTSSSSLSLTMFTSNGKASVWCIVILLLKPLLDLTYQSLKAYLKYLCNLFSRKPDVSSISVTA